MKSKLMVLALASIAATSANAQLGGISGARFKIGYGWSGTIKDVNDNGRHLQGPELGVDIPLSRLPMVDIALTGNVLLGGQLTRGSDLDGYVYRLMLSARAHIPGSRASAFLGAGWATAQPKAGEFRSFNGTVTQLGIAFPLGTNTPVFTPELELTATLGSKTGLGGFGAGVSFKF